MHRLAAFALVALLFLAVGCGGDDPQPPPEPSPEADLPPILDFERADPPAYLDLLARHPGELVTVGAAPKGWITEAHVEALLSRVDDDAPAAVTVALVSSYIPFGETSTVGREALFLIQGFREGHYPPAICSVGYFDPDPAGARRWWAERSRKR